MTTPRVPRLASTSLCGVVLLVACSTNEDEATVGVSFATSEVVAVGARNAFQQFSIVVTLANPPVVTPYVQVIADGPGVLPADTRIVQVDKDRYEATFTLDATQAADVYTGKLFVRLCNDAQCTSLLSTEGGMLPYSVTIMPDPVASVRVGDTVLAKARDGRYPVRSGDVVTIGTSIPATWTVSGRGYEVLNSTTSSRSIAISATTASTIDLGLDTAAGTTRVGLQVTP